MISAFLKVLFLLAFSAVTGTLMSRFKNPYEYIAGENSMGFDDLDEKTYKNLMEDLPQLKHMVKTGKHSYRRQEHDDFGLDGEDYETDFNDTSTVYQQAVNVTSTRMPYKTYWPQPVTSNSSRRFFNFFLSPYVGRRVAICYWCGLSNGGIPLSPLCHDMFDSQNGRARTLSRFYRAYCFYNRPRDNAHRKRTWYFGGYKYEYDRGLINEYYGAFQGGCFKRFLDVGEVYTQRGCRAWWPTSSWHVYGWYNQGRARSFAAHRFKRLEGILKKEKEMCIVSPHASLTPFARGISLYVRYHVCVCNNKYCNGGESVGLSLGGLLISVMCWFNKM